MFTSLPGFRDFYPADCATKNYIFSVWHNIAQRYGFVEYDTPVLEPLGLFIQKSGPSITEQLFSFTDQGGRKVA